MPKSTYTKNKMLDARYGGSWTKPGTVYGQLHSGDPGATGAANQITGIPRVAITNDATRWPDAVGGVKQNGLAISWGATTGLTGLGTATYASFWDALSGGNMLDYGTLTPPLDLDDRADLRIEAGQCQITET